ncbi:hypothetical protein HPB47_022449, partial [Ixodes persulcatus]
VEFQVSVELVNCPADASSHVFRISPVGVNEYVEIQVEPICSCDCEAPQRTETNSSRCNGRGSSACGVCSCDPKFYGKQCECLDTELQLHKALCQASNSSTELCSNRGECVCGECQCYNPQGGGRVFGQWCQCDSFSCERDAESRVCGGPERGQCCGGECQCNTGWGGSACDCSADTSTCVAPGDPAGRMCGGHGDCVCGACRCRADAGGRYSGPFCQDCAACVGRCSEFRSCVQCTMFGSAEQSEKCRSECSKLNIVPVDKAEGGKSAAREPVSCGSLDLIRRPTRPSRALVDPKEVTQHEAGPEERKCIFKDVDDCFFSFVYYYDENNEPVIEAQKTKECGKEALTWYIVGGVVGGIVIFGLLAVCIGRFLLYLKDKLEYEKFVKERKNAAWRLEMNPIFKEPVSEYRNPMYETGQSSTAGLSSSRS